MIRTECYVLSRVKGRTRWHRHIPGYATRQKAEERAAEYTEEHPDREYTVRDYETAPAPTYPNGQRRR